MNYDVDFSPDATCCALDDAGARCPKPIEFRPIRSGIGLCAEHSVQWFRENKAMTDAANAWRQRQPGEPS